MPQKSVIAKEQFLKDKDIQRWYQNLARGAEVTADTYYRRMRAFCTWAETTPANFINMEEKPRFDLLLDFVSHEEKRGMSGAYIDSTLKAINSWLSFNGIAITRKIKIKGGKKPTTLDNERVPRKNELRQIFMSATKRDRVSCVLMAHAGVRPETLGNYKGNDGLRVKDFPEMRIQNGTIMFDRIPTMIIVRPELSKAGHRYITFIGNEACEYLKDYLEERMRDGETLNPTTDIIHPKSATKHFIRTINIGDGIRNSIRSAGFQWRPYVLRSYFNTNLQIAASNGKITESYRKYFFGHTGDMEARYSLNKNVLTEDIIEDLREAYNRSQEYLQTTPSGKEKTGAEMRAEVRRLFYEMAGCTEEELEKIDFDNINHDEFVEHVRKRLFESGDQAGNASNGNHSRHAVGNNEGTVANNANGSRHIIVSPENAETLLQQGYGFVQELRGGNLILQAPY